MHDETIDDFLDRLAARTPTPAGGAVAAHQSAQAAALVAMVARFAAQGKNAEQTERLEEVVRRAEVLRAGSSALAAEDERAYDGVASAYRMPADEDPAARKAALERALVAASAPPAAVIEVAAQLIGLAEELLPLAGRTTLPDLAAAASSIESAVTISALNAEVNLRGAASVPDRLATAADSADDVMQRSDTLRRAVRRSLRLERGR